MKNLFNFNFKHLKGDAFGGLTAGIVALPLALAFGLQSGLGAAAGLYGAIFISFFAALFGGTNTQISGPTAPMTAVSMIVIAGIVAANEGDLSRALPAILMVFLLAGLFQIVLGFLGIGKYIRFIPYPVVSGFMTGIGVIILITQILPMMGYYPKEDQTFVNEFIPEAEEVILERILREEAAADILVLEDFKETVKRAGNIEKTQIIKEAKILAGSESAGVMGALKMIPRAFSNISYIDLILALLTIFIIFGFKRITTAIPSTLVALLAVSIGAYFIVPGYRSIGNIPSGFPSINLEIITGFNFAHVSPYIFTAMSLSALGAIDSLLTSIVADNMTKTKHNPNRELIGQGIGNSIAALFGGIPGAGATIRTVVNINSGGQTRLSGMIAGLILLFVLMLLGPLASKIPAAVLAGILITVGIGVMDYRGLKNLKQIPRSEVLVLFTVLILTVFIGLIEAVVVGLILSSILFMKKLSDVVDDRTEVAPLYNFSKDISWLDDDNDSLGYVNNHVYLKQINGPLFFGFSSRFQDLVNDIPDIEVIIIDMKRVPFVDQSGVYAMEDVIKDLQSNGIKVVFTNLHGEPLQIFEQFKIVPNLVEAELCFPDFAACSIWLQEKYDQYSADNANNVKNEGEIKT